MTRLPHWRLPLRSAFTHRPGKRFLPAVIASVLLMAWAIPALAHHVPFFEIDGDFIPFNEPNNPPTSIPAEDWNGVIPGPPAILIQDVHSKVASDPSIFSPAGKFLEPQNWTVSSGVVGSAQSELTNVGVLPVLPGDFSQDDSWLIMFLERTKKEGTFALDFEFNQQAWDGTSGTLVRTVGDLVVGFELAGNPDDPQQDLKVLIASYIGVGATPPDLCTVTLGNGNKVEAVEAGTDPCPSYGGGFVYRFLAPANVLGDFGEARMNNVEIDAGEWGSLDEQGNPRTKIGPFEVGEAALNLTELNLEPGCPGFGSVHAKSRSSLEPGSDLKDLAGPEALEIRCKISGYKFEDLDGDGQAREAGEPGLQGWTIFVDSNNDGDLDTGEPSTTTDSSGYYEFSGLGNGTHIIRELCESGWTQSYPAPSNGCGTGTQSVTVNINNLIHENVNFGNWYPSTKSGTKFHDLDGDGQAREAGEPGLSGWVIYVDYDGNSSKDAGEPFATTDADGNYTITGIKPGSFNVREVLQATWFCSFPANCYYAETFTSQSTKTGNDFGNYQKAKIIVEKQTVPDGDAQIFQFNTTGTGYTGFNLSDGQTNDSGLLNPGSYSVAEVVPSGWDLTNLVITDGNGGSAIDPVNPSKANVGLSSGETVYVTFTNTKRAKILVDKVTVPAGDSQQFAFTLTGGPSTLNQSFNLTDAAAPHDSGFVLPGSGYAAAETVPTGWDLTSAVCNDGSPASNIDLSAGETVTCTFTNTKRAKIIVDKVTNPAGDAQSFQFNTTGSGYNGFNLTDAAAPNDSGFLVAGSYSVAEVVPAGWDLTSLVVNDPDNGSTVNGATASIALAPGETVYVTFTNTKRAKIIVDKVTVPAGDSQSFEFDPSWSATNFSLTDTATPYDSGLMVAGAYSVSETVPSGWSLTSAVCDDGSAVNAINLSPGETVTCTFTNTKLAKIIVDKVTVPSGDPTSFAFTTTGSGYNSFSLTDAATPNSSGFLMPGSYSVAETVPAGWELTNLVITDPNNNSSASSPTANIALGAGETVYVTFTNTKLVQQGCTPGWWQSKNGVARWDNPTDPLAVTAGFYTGTSFNSFFNLTAAQSGFADSFTMLDAINANGGGGAKLARHGVSALLNIADGDMSYPLTDATALRNDIRNAYLSGTFEPLATQLAAYNDLDHAACGEP